MEKVYVPTDPHEKAMQRALIQYRNPRNYYLVREALIAAHREDLIGSGPKCLIRAIPPKAGGYTSGGKAAAKSAGPHPHGQTADRRSAKPFPPKQSRKPAKKR